MTRILFCLSALLLAIPAAHAQSALGSLPAITAVSAVSTVPVTTDNGLNDHKITIANLFAPTIDQMTITSTLADASTNVVVSVDTQAPFTAGKLLNLANNGTNKFSVTHLGAIAAGTTNTWATGAVATSTNLTINATNYISITVNGIVRKLALAD